jgi:hypothetical protein
MAHLHDPRPLTGRGDLRDDAVLVGRTEELSMLIDQLSRGRHTLLVGERGVGKTRLMREAVAVVSGKKKLIENRGWMIEDPGKKERLVPVYVWHCAPLGDCLKEICCRLYQHADLRTDALGDVDVREWAEVKKRLTGLGAVGIQNLVFESLEKSAFRYVFFFDSLDRISPAHQQFLEKLLSLSVVCAAVVRLKEGTSFKKIWASFARLPVLPLRDEDSARLIRVLLGAHRVHVIDRGLYSRQIIKAANGNPFHIRNMLWHGSLERKLGDEEIRSLQRVEEGEWMNMGPAYIFIASVFTLFKIFSIGTERSEFYVYFSALGFLVYLTFRVFRTFFLFRPQRWGV